MGVISGSITPATGGGGATVILSGTENATVQADANGDYFFAGLPNGSYSVTPSKTGFAFSPVSHAVSLSGTNQTAVNFAAQAISSTWSISGSISSATSGGGATMTLSGSSSGAVIADANGNYSLNGLANGSYTVTPNKTGFTFAPLVQSVTLNGANQAAVNFTAQGTGPTWSISAPSVLHREETEQQ